MYTLYYMHIYIIVMRVIYIINFFRILNAAGNNSFKMHDK